MGKTRFPGVVGKVWTVAFLGLSAMAAPNEASVEPVLPVHISSGGDDTDPEQNPRHPYNWEQHDPDRPQPPVVDPGPYSGPQPPPSDATVLFDGTSFEHWNHERWELTDDGAMQVVPGEGDLTTRETFGDVQLYIEFWCDPDSPGEGGNRSNSGVFFGPYEVQVLDSYENPIPADKINAGIYGQYPPLVNASRPPGEWQTFNITYTAPRFDGEELIAPARITVFHNGIAVQINEPLVGPTTNARRTDYEPHGDVPIRLQDHRDDPIKFRNIWVRELDPGTE